MEMLGTVNQWIETARGLLAKQVHIPLIDNCEIDMTDGLVDASMNGDYGLRAATDNVLSRDPNDVAARFVALNAYCRLMALPGAIENDEEDVEADRQELREHLGYLVRLRDTTSCTDVISIRWEIVNACAVQDHERAIALCDQLTGLLPASECHYLHGRLYFLIALRNSWDTEESLVLWDLPLGAAPDRPRAVLGWLHASFLHMAGIQKLPTRERLTESDRDHLRDAIKYLEKATASEQPIPASTRLMLARSYASIGDGHNAAKHYHWMVDHHSSFLQSCAQEQGPLWDEWFSRNMRPELYACLVNAYDDAGELDKAIDAAEAWIAGCPDHLGTYGRMARLQQKRCDPVAAAEWLRKEADRNPALGEDPNVSIVLALGGIAPRRIDEALKSIGATHPQELALVQSVVTSYWPTFAHLKKDAQQRWVIGTWFLGTKAPQGPGLAVHCFTWVVEQELRTTIFERFAEHARSRPDILALCTGDEEARRFCGYLKGYGTITLGQMFTILGLARRSPVRMIASFAQWLNRERPWLLTQIDRLQIDTIISFRNREDHADMHGITTHEAEAMSRICREVINILYPR